MKWDQLLRYNISNNLKCNSIEFKSSSININKFEFIWRVNCQTTSFAILTLCIIIMYMQRICDGEQNKFHSKLLYTLNVILL